MPGNSAHFSSIPILDYSLLSTPAGHKEFVDRLRHALVHVGFLYLANPPVARADIDALVEYTPRLFDVPQEEKDRIRMSNSPHFFGYTRFGAEITKGKTDQREQFDFGTPYENRWQPGDPEYLKLWGQPQVGLSLFISGVHNVYTQRSCQWLPEELLPGFKETYLRYLDQVEQLSYEFIELIAEAFEVPNTVFAPFFNRETRPKPGIMQHRSKIVKYPARKEGESDQGVGPHFDGGFLTFVRVLLCRSIC